MIEIRVPLHKDNMPQSPNVKTHHMVQYLRNKKLGEAITWAFKLTGRLQDARSMLATAKNSCEDKNPFIARICYIRPRELDYVNLVSSLKHAQDVIADILIPGLKAGRADGDKRILWDFMQKKGLPKEYALLITFTDNS